MHQPPRPPLYVLRFDHRVPFLRSLFGIGEDQAPDEAQRGQIGDLKMVVYEGLLAAIAAGTPKESVMAVVDEAFATDVARRAKADSVPVAISVERSGRDEFEFEYGDDFARHIEEIDPDFVKALVRYNSAGDTDVNARQRERLAVLSDWLRRAGRSLVFELLVPPTPAQLERVDGDLPRYEREMLPEIVVGTIATLQDADVEADVWMVPGLNSRPEYERAAAQVHQGGRSGVLCLVLGQGPDAGRVSQWIREASSAAGYGGMAVAQTIWLPTLMELHGGTLSRLEATDRIATNFRDMIAIYEAGASTRQ